MRVHVVGHRGTGMVCQPSEASRECPRGHPLQIGGRPVPVDAPTCCGQCGGRFSLTASETGAVNAVNDRLFPIGHHDGVAQDVNRAESEKLALDRIDDTDFRIEYAAVAGTDRRDQSDHLAMLGREPVVHRSRVVAEVVGVGDPGWRVPGRCFLRGRPVPFREV